MSTTAVAKPQLRGLAERSWARVLYGSLFVAGAFAVWFKYQVLEKRKRHYKEFYETYDDQKAFEAMRAAGVFKGFEWDE